MRRFFAAVCVWCLGAVIQAVWAQTPARGSISGVVRTDTAGALPKDVAVIAISSKGVGLPARPDAEGRYRIANLPPGDYSVSAVAAGNAVTQGRLIRLAPGQDISVDLVAPAGVMVSGRIIDENGEPVPRAQVFVVRKEYRAGELGYYAGSPIPANERGEYATTGLMPGRSYLLMAKGWRPFTSYALEPRERKPVLIPAYFPGTESLQAAETIIPRAGERREGVNIRLKNSPAYCIDGVLDEEGRPGEIEFEFAEVGPSGGAPLLRSAGNGRFRICNLHSGDYRLTVASGASEGSWTLISVRDGDRQDLKVHAGPGTPPAAEVLWAGEAPEKTPEGKLTMSIRSLGDGLSQQISFPLEAGPFYIPRLTASDYEVKVSGTPRGIYVKDISYGAQSVLQEPLRFGVSSGAVLRVVLAREGGSIRAGVADGEGAPVLQAWVYMIPESARSPAALSTVLVAGRTDQTGTFLSGTLPPGKYYVVASETEVFPTPESMDALWRARPRATEAEIAPGATAAINLEILEIR